MAAIQIPTGPAVVGRDRVDRGGWRIDAGVPAEAGRSTADAGRPTAQRAEPDPLSDAELAAQAEARSERLRTWLPTVVSVAALVGMAAVAAYAARTVVGFGMYLVGLIG